MDYLNKFTGKDDAGAPPNTTATEASTSTTRSDASSGGFMGSINSALGGGAKGEKKEDGLDKAVDWAQEHILGQGPQTNEGAVEQAKDEAMSDAIRAQYKNMTGKDFPIADK